MLRYWRTSIDHLFFYIGILCLSVNLSFAQNASFNAEMDDSLTLAKELLVSFKNDSAMLILTKLEKGLATKKELDSPFGLQVQIQQAIGLEQDHQDEKAIQKLIHIVEVAPQYEQWKPLAHAYLSLARLHEKLGRKDDCLSNLRKAQSTIKRYQIEDIYPRFSIRIASYHRIFAERDSAIYYAKEVLRTAPKYELYQEEAVGNLLMGLLLNDEDYKEAVEYFKKAGNHWELIEDHSGHWATHRNISRLYLKNKELELAMFYCDTALIVAQKAADGGNEQLYLFYESYQHKAQIYKALGQMDSAFHYLEKGYTMEIDEVYQANNEKVIEIEAKYQDEKKAQKITQQELQIKEDRERMYLLLGFTSIIFLLLSLLSYYYLRLRKANRKTEAQSLAIRQANKDLSNSLEQQILLQAEVHHRVKNNLQVIISLLELHMDEMDAPKSVQSFEDMINRIHSIASIHEILYQQEEAVNVNFGEYVNSLCLHFGTFRPLNEKPVFKIDIKNQFFNLATSMPLGIILTELLTNSLKYGVVKGRLLKINIQLKQLEHEYCLTYRDNGPGFPNEHLQERIGGLGTYLLLNVSRQLKGRIESKNENGALSYVYFQSKN